MSCIKITFYVLPFLFLTQSTVIMADSQGIDIPKAITITDSDIKPDLFPAVIEKLIAEFNNPNEILIHRGPFFNRIILHGPHGTGKTTITRYFAQKTNSEYIYLSAASLLNTYQNSGAVIMKKLFIHLKEQAAIQGKKLVVLIDEADKMSAPNAKDNLKVAMDSTVAELWQGLDMIQDHRNIRIFLTTNHLKKTSSPGLIERFVDTRIIHVPGLDDDKRKEYIRTLFITMQLPSLQQRYLDMHVAQLEQYSPSAKTKLNSHFQDIRATCQKVQKQLTAYALEQNPTDHSATIALFNTLQKQHDELLKAAQSNKVATQGAPRQIITSYSSLLENYINLTQERLRRDIVRLNQEQLTKLTEQTKGFSIRYIIELISSIHDHAHLNNGELKDESVYWDKLAKVKTKASHTEAELAKQEDDERQRYLQEKLAFRTAVRQYYSEHYYAPLSSQTEQASANMSLALLSGSAGQSVTKQHKENIQNPTIEEIHDLSKQSNDPLKKQVAEFLLKQEKPTN